MTDTDKHDWDGTPLGAGPIAVVLLPDAEQAAPACHAPVLAAATADAACVHVGQQQLAAFLRVHANRQLVCHDAAHVHWTLVRCLERTGDSRAISFLWGFSRGCRLNDVGLFAQRLRLITNGQHTAIEPLEQIAESLGHPSVSSEVGSEKKLGVLLIAYQENCKVIFRKR